MAQKQWRVLRHAAMRRAFDQRRQWGAVVLIHPAMEPLMRDCGYPAHRLVVLRNPAEPYQATRLQAEGGDEAVFIGRLDRDKGVHLLATAAAAVGLKLTMIGTGPAEAEVARLNPAARMTGWCERAAFPPLLERAAVLVAPSIMPEPFGLSIAEASASGLPVVVSDNALVAPEIVDLDLGWVFRSGDVADLTTTLERVAAAPPDRLQRISERGFARHGGLSTTEEKWSAVLEDLYRSLIA